MKTAWREFCILPELRLIHWREGQFPGPLEMGVVYF